MAEIKTNDSGMRYVEPDEVVASKLTRLREQREQQAPRQLTVSPSKELHASPPFRDVVYLREDIARNEGIAIGLEMAVKEAEIKEVEWCNDKERCQDRNDNLGAAYNEGKEAAAIEIQASIKSLSPDPSAYARRIKDEAVAAYRKESEQSIEIEVDPDYSRRIWERAIEAAAAIADQEEADGRATHEIGVRIRSLPYDD